MADFSDAVPAFRTAFETFGALDGTPACEVIPELLSDGDLTLLKTGSGGFNSSALDIHLRNMGIKQVIYTGVVTNGCVMLAAAQGFDLGYLGYLVTDATATFSQELQDQAEDVIGFYFAKSVTTDAMIALLPSTVATEIIGAERTLEMAAN
jgi:nicotinamidase-related amidase